MFKALHLLNELLSLKIKTLAEPVAADGTDKLFHCIKSIEKGSSKFSAWSLTVLGGTLLAILNSEYLHPEETELKMVYLLFIAGWIFIGLSLYNGKEIAGRTIASELYKDDMAQLRGIFIQCNKCYFRQLRFFNWALLLFGIWLLLYLLWWVFYHPPVHPSTTSL